MTITYNINSKGREQIRMGTEQHEKKPFSRSDVVDYEIARDRINSFACYWSRQISKEEKKECPDRARIKALEAYASTLHKEHKFMTMDDQDLIDKSNYIYGPILKALTSASGK